MLFYSDLMSNLKIGVPFYLEVYVDDESKFNPEQLDAIIEQNSDLIPGLKISKAFEIGCSQDSMVCQELENDLNSLVEHINKITEKYGNFQEDNLIDTLISECGKKPEDFGKFNEDRAWDIQRMIQNRDDIGLTKDGHYIKK